MPEPKPAAAEKPAAPAQKDELLEAAQAKSGPHLTREFMAQHGLDDTYLQQVADGLIPGPPNIGPNPTVDLHNLPGGWTLMPKGVPLEDALKGQIGAERRG